MAYDSPRPRVVWSGQAEESSDEDLKVRQLMASSGAEVRGRAAAGMGTNALIARNTSAVPLVYLVNFMDNVGGSISTPVLPFYAHEFNATSVQIGQLYSAFALTQVLAMPLLGRLSDKCGRRPVLLFSTLGNVVGSAWQGLAGSYWTLLSARAFTGISAGVSSVCQIYISDVAPSEFRVEYLNYLLSSTQASILFGPSIGAGLSVLGLNIPLLIQALVSAILLLVVWAHLPESPEWLRTHSEESCSAGNGSCGNGTCSIRAESRRSLGIGFWGTSVAIAMYGGVAFLIMIAQMCVVSMWAVFAKDSFQLDALRVGFVTTLGALASISTNVWVSPCIQRRLGDLWASILGSCMVVVGALSTINVRLPVSLAGYMLAFQGIAINSGAVASGTAKLTDSRNRSQVVTGVRMMKSLGAVVGPTIAGVAAGKSKRLPFVVAAIFAFLAGVMQVMTMGLEGRVHKLLLGRRTVGLATGLLDSAEWQDEVGTPEEICDLGEYVADLLTSRHYKWVTYNSTLKRVLSDFFPPLRTVSEEAYVKSYNKVKDMARQTTVNALLSSPCPQ